MKALIALILAAVGFGFSTHAPAPVPSTVPTRVDVTIQPGPALSPMPTPKIEVIQIRGATDAEIAVIDKGIEIVNERLASACFRQWVLAARYTENNGLTQAQIYNLTQSKPVVVKVEMYTGTYKANHISKTVGYENDPYDGWVHLNRYFVKTPLMVADNLIHEAEGHSQGFHHYGVKATSDPYGMNYALEGCSQQQMQAESAKPFKPPGIRLEIRKVRKGK